MHVASAREQSKTDQNQSDILRNKNITTNKQQQIQDANIPVWQGSVKSGETLLVPPGFLTAMCVDGDGDVCGAKQLFCAKGQIQRTRFTHLAEMADTTHAKDIIKTTTDAMALLEP